MATDPPNLSPSDRVFDDDDLLTEILLRLPTKPLLTFKSVSRIWCSIISSAPFARIHTLLHPPTTAPSSAVFLRKPNFADYHYRLLSLPSGPLSPTPFRFNFPFLAPKLLQSCNGLLLFSIDGENPNFCKSYCLYNPATSQFKALPSLILSSSARVLGVSLAFDPSRFHGSRVVCVATTDSSVYTYRIFLYTSSGGAWKEWEGNPFNAPYDVVFIGGVYWNGGVYWISLREDSVWFDVEGGSLRRFQSPPTSPRKRGFRQFCEFNGELHYVDGNEYRSPVCKVFAFVGNGEGWVLRYSVDVPEVMIGERCGLSMLCLVVGERLEMVVHICGKILGYDLERKNWRTICGFESVGFRDGSAPSDRLQLGWFDAYPYTATLALF